MTVATVRLLFLFTSLTIGILHAQLVWITVSQNQRVNLDYVSAVELVENSNGTGRVAYLLMPGRQFSVNDPGVFALIDSVIGAAPSWLKVSDVSQIPSGTKTRRFVKQATIVAVEFSCPTMASCSAHLDGYEGSYKKLLADEPAAVANLRTDIASGGLSWLLFDDPGAPKRTKGYEVYVARKAIRRVDFTFSIDGKCTQAEAYLSGGTGGKVTSFSEAIGELMGRTK